MIHDCTQASAVIAAPLHRVIIITRIIDRRLL
jgi:hypothetical protein